MHTRLITGPASLPLSLAEAKEHLRLEHEETGDDAEIYALIRAAMRHTERLTGRALISQTWELRTAAFVDGIELPRAPAQSISSVVYLDQNNAEQTLASSVYELENAGAEFARGRLRLAYDQSWPSALDRHDAVRVQWVAGYGDDWNSIDADLKVALLLLLSHWYEHREAVVVGASVVEVPLAYDALIASFRLPGF